MNSSGCPQLPPVAPGMHLWHLLLGQSLPRLPLAAPQHFPFPARAYPSAGLSWSPENWGCCFPVTLLTGLWALLSCRLPLAPSQDFVFLTSFSGSLLHLWFPPFPCLQQLLVPVTALPELCLVPFRMCFPCLPWTVWTRRSHGWTQ